MSYREENGQVVLTMSREEYHRVLMIFGIASATCVYQGRVTSLVPLDDIIRTLNRLNEGNPNYTPYRVSS